MPVADIVRSTLSISSGGATTDTSITISAPADVAAGDQFLFLASHRDQHGATLSAPAGWNHRHRIVDSSAGEGWFFQAKYGTDITGTSWTFTAGDGTTDKWTVAGLVLKNVGDYLTSTAQERTTAVSTVDTGAITTAASANIIALAGDRASGSTWTWPAGWAEQVDVLSDAGGTNAVSSSCAVYDTVPTAAGTYSVTATSTGSTDDAWAGIFAFAAAATNLNKLKLGADTPSKLYVGADAVSKVYLGDTQVWP